MSIDYTGFLFPKNPRQKKPAAGIQRTPTPPTTPLRRKPRGKGTSTRKRKCAPPKPCKACGGPCPEFRLNGSWKEQSGTCSPACTSVLREKKREQKKRRCRHCDKLFSLINRGTGRNQSFCSQKCHIAHAHPDAWTELPCDNCAKIVRRRKDWVKRGRDSHIFCDRECMTKFRVGENNSSWRGGSDPNRGKGWLKISESARHRDGYRCRRCKKTQEENGQKLSVDHILPWRDFADDKKANNLDNLASLCRSCHSRKCGLERQWLKGDWTALESYRRSIGPHPEV